MDNNVRVQTAVTKEIDSQVADLAKGETRSKRQMYRILIKEAIENRKSD